MPRHPPYALVTKQQHTTKTTNKQPPHHNGTAIISLSGKLTIKKFFHKNKDARVHYTVLTQHTPHTNHHHTAAINMQNHKTTTIAAPDTQQCTNDLKHLLL